MGLHLERLLSPVSCAFARIDILNRAIAMRFEVVRLNNIGYTRSDADVGL